MNETRKHLESALDQYRKLFEEHKDIEGDWQTKAARLGMRKAAYQLGDLFLKQSLEDSTNHAYKTEPERQSALDYERRQAVQYFEKLLSTYEPKPNDLEIGRLLVWLGGLHKALGENDNEAKERARQYFNRVLTALSPENSSDADALALVGDTLYFKGQIVEAVDFYQQAGMRYGESGNIPSQAYMDYHCGRIYERLSNFARAAGYYSDAVRLYRTAFEQNKTAIPSDSLFAIGSFFRQLGNDVRAQEAFDLVINVVTKTDADYYKIYLARAYGERGAILSLQKKPREALDAYRQAIAGYDEIVSAPYIPSEMKQQAVTERERAKLIVKALESVP
jgi:tetratricopeptide (TPR) repeat protein